MTDVLIAGGGIAGSALAIMLGHAGFTVELFERGTFPKEKACGEGLMPAGVALLAELGLADAVGGAPFRGVRYHAGSIVAAGRFPTDAVLPATGRGQRRRHIDQVLFAAAAATPGVTARTGVRVEAPISEYGRVVGLVVEGEQRRAPLVVAADGLHSTLRHRLGLEGAPVRGWRVGLRTHFCLAPGQVQPPWVEVFMGNAYELYVTPLPQHEILVAGLAPRGALVDGAEAAFRRWIDEQPTLRARLEGAEQVTELLAMSPLASRTRAGVTPGAVLLGDAAGFLDPITGGGMTQALLTAKLLARHARRSLGTGDTWLWAFEHERHALLRDYRLLTRMVLGLAAHPWIARQALRLLRSMPRLFSYLIGVGGGVRHMLSPNLQVA